MLTAFQTGLVPCTAPSQGAMKRWLDWSTGGSYQRKSVSSKRARRGCRNRDPNRVAACPMEEEEMGSDLRDGADEVKRRERGRDGK
jgi:hypothetical protein